MSKVLFVYPNKEGYPIIPLGISVLSGLLKHHGHEVALFDVTFMISRRYDHEAREKTGVVDKVDVQKYWCSGDDLDMEAEFAKKIEAFQPDLIAFSIVENNYPCARKLFRIARQHSSGLIIAGGLFPTVVPDYFIQDANVDLICIGEGEYAICGLAAQLDRQGDVSRVTNVIVKNGEQVMRGSLARYYDWEPPVFQDWEIFDQRHLLKPFMGKMYRTGFFELSRGCPYNCAYCINRLNQKIFKGLGRYNREKRMAYAIKEIEHLKQQYRLELVFFNDENFLTMRKERLEEFCETYTASVGLPFFIMTRADGLMDETKVKLLKDAGCVTIGIGVESGNEEIRRKLLNKNIPNAVYEQAFANCHKYDIRTTANIMIGLPFETEENVIESAEFCRKLQARSLSMSIFAPYHGTKLREICIEKGFIEDTIHEDIATINRSILTMAQLSREKIEELYYKFNDLVYGQGRS